jgi:hypothetical protein
VRVGEPSQDAHSRIVVLCCEDGGGGTVAGRDQEGYPSFSLCTVVSFSGPSSSFSPGRPPRPIPGGPIGLPALVSVVLVSRGYLSVVSSSWSRFSCRPPSPVISLCSPPSLFVGKDTGKISTHHTRTHLYKHCTRGYRFLPWCLPEYHGICILYTTPPRHRHDGIHPSCLAPYPARYTLNSPYVPNVEQLLSAVQEGLSCRVQRHVGGNTLGGMVGCLRR